MADADHPTSLIPLSFDGAPVRVVTAIEDVPDERTALSRVYAIEFAGHPVKIGVSTSLRKRVASIRIEHARFGLPTSLASVAFSEPCFNANQSERDLLVRFAASRVNGEYIDAPFEAVVVAMNSMEFRSKPNADDAAKEKRAREFLDGLINFITGDARSTAERMAKLEGIVRAFSDAVIGRDRRAALRLALDARLDPLLFPQTKTTIEDVAHAPQEFQDEFLKEARLIWGAKAAANFRAQIAAIHSSAHQQH